MSRYNFTNGYVVEYDTRCFSSWLLLPAELLWPGWLRGVLYAAAIVYIFLGVAIVADIFMLSIEIITSKRRVVVTYDYERQETVEREVLVWNETVANLTLMALGSSAPEILIAVIETLTNLSVDPEASPALGTFTIVGSAAYNLLIISAVCIASVEKDTVKRINEFGVFLVTSLWSLFAYVWLLVVLKWSSPNVVEVWEAVFTLACFPLMVLSAWCQDRGWLMLTCLKRKPAGLNQNRSLQHIPRTSPEHHIVGIEQTDSASRRTSKWTAQDGGSGSHMEMKRIGANRPELRELVHYIQDHNDGETSPGMITNSIKLLLDNNKPSSKAVARARFRHAVVSSLLGSSRHSANTPNGDAVVEAMKKRSLRSNSCSSPPSDSPYGLFTFSTSSYSVVKKEKIVTIEILYQVTFPRSAPVGFSHIVKAARDQAASENKNAAVSQMALMRKASQICAQDINFSSRTMTSSLSTTEGMDEMDFVDAPNPSLQNNVDVRDSTNGSPQEFATPPDFVFRPEDTRTLSRVSSAADLLRVGSSVEYETRDGTAKRGVDYTYSKGSIEFSAKQYRQYIKIALVEGSDVQLRDRDFFVILKNPSSGSVLGTPNIIQVSIINDSQPGVFSFEEATYPVDLITGSASVTVSRRNGCDGHVTLRFRTVDGTAIGGNITRLEAGDCEFEAVVDGRLDFRPGETRKEILLSVAKYPKKGMNFIVLLQEPGNGAILGHRSAAIVTLTSDMDDIVDQVANMISEESTKKTLGEHWREQFATALSPNLRDEQSGKFRPINGVLHFVSFFWKILCACLPPRACGGGWPTFLASLALLGILSAFVEQFAKLLGCVLGLHVSVTGLTLIALGTSMPDTFASRSAALQDDSADAAIGNITGSNSVNVFLGLGLPWCILSLYHHFNGSTVRVSDSDLFFTVIVFLSCGVICIIILILRRTFCKGELGGSAPSKFASSALLASLWVLFIVVCSLRAYNLLPSL